MQQQTTQASNSTSLLPDDQSTKKTPTIAEDVATIKRLAEGRRSWRTRAEQEERLSEIAEFCEKRGLSETEFDSYAQALQYNGGYESVAFSLHRKAEDFASDVALS